MRTYTQNFLLKNTLQALGILLLFGIGWGCQSERKTKISPKKTIQKIVNVSVLKTKYDTFKNYITLRATAESEKNIVLGFESSGHLKKIHVQEGAVVKKGMLLAALDCQVIDANINEMEVRLRFAKAIYKKQKQLWDKKIGSELKYLESKNQKETLAQKMNLLKGQKKMRQIFAPFDGKVGNIFVKQHDMCNAGTKIMRLSNTKKLYLKCEISEKYINHISKKSPVAVHFPVINKNFKGRIVWISEYINPKNRTFRIKIVLHNDKNIKLGLIGHVKINYQNLEKQIILPENILQKDMNDNYFVYVAQDKNGQKIAKKTFVTLGDSYQGKTIITKGLQDNFWVVEKGVKNLVDNAAVKIIK